MSAEAPVVAIDGPAGSGKSTVAKGLARRLGFLYIDSGAMYRCVTLAAQRAGADFGDPAALAAVAEAAAIRLEQGHNYLKVFLGDEEVENLLRTPEISRLTSAHTANAPGVRTALVARQRALGRAGSVVMEGRDIGTVVFPDADLKVYFDVSVEERVRRRVADYQSRGIPADPEGVRADIVRRDEEDMRRPIGALRRADDAVLVQGDGKSVDALIEEIAALLPPPRTAP